MKKIPPFSSLLLTLFIAISASACSIFGNDSNGGKNNDSTPKSQTITVYKDDTPTTYTVENGEIATIDVFTKAGFYFTGAYDAPENGTKYFDSKGESTVVWGAGNPDTFYARFENVSTLAYSNIQYDEEPFGWSGPQRYVTFDFDDDLKSAIAGNLDATLQVTVSLKVSCDRSWNFGKISLTNLKNGGETFILGKDIAITEKTYTSVSYTQNIPARLVKNGAILIGLEGKSANVTTAKYYFKNLSVSIKFAN